MNKLSDENQKSASLKKWAVKFSAKSRKKIEATKKFKAIKKAQDAVEQRESNNLFNFYKIKQSQSGYLYYLTDHDIYKNKLDDFLKGKDSWNKTFNTLRANIDKKFHLEKIIELKHNGKTLALAHLSKLGSDKVITREINYKTKRLVPCGFSLPLGRHDVIWLSHDKLIGAIEFNENSLTSSMHPKNIYILKRGESAEKAKVVFSIPDDHVLISPVGKFSKNRYVLLHDLVSFYSNVYYFFEIKTQKNFQFRIPIYANIETFFKDDIYIHINKDWDFDENTKFKRNSILRINTRNLIKNSFSQLEKEDIFSCITLQENELFRKILVNSNHTSYVIFHSNYEVNIIKIYELKDKIIIKPIFRSEPYANLSYTFTDKNENLVFKIITLLNPSCIYFYCAKRRKTRKISSSQSHFNPNNYTLLKKDISHQGVTISYHYIFKNGLTFDGKNPTILNGYGGFNSFNHPDYLQAKEAILLRQGFVLAFAHIRGGGELGEAMHLDGIADKKQNCFNDFIAIAKDLIDSKITSPRFLGIEGGSNGGLVVATCMTQRPDLFGAVFCDAGLLDMLHYHKMLVGKIWLAEYGNPENPIDRKILESYSPLHHVISDKQYPPMMLQASSSDDRVDPTHSRAMAKALYRNKQPVIYIEDKEGGHTGVTVTTLARKYTFWHQKLLAPAKRAREEASIKSASFFSSETPSKQKRRTELRPAI